MQMDTKAPPFLPPRSTHFSSPSFTPHVTLGHVAGEEREVLSLLEKLARETSTFPVDARSKGRLMLMARVICKTWIDLGTTPFCDISRRFKMQQSIYLKRLLIFNLNIWDPSTSVEIAELLVGKHWSNG